MPLFVRSFHLTSHGLHCSHFTTCTHHSTPLFGSQMEEQQNVPQPNWTTWWNHFCYTGIPWLSALHCLQQLRAGACPTPVAQPLFFKQESNDTTPPVPSPQPPLSSVSSHFPVRLTSDVRTQMGPLCLPNTTLPQQTPPRNSPSRSLCSFTKHPFRHTVPPRIQ